MNFLVGDRQMLDTAGNDDEFPLANQLVAVTKAHAQSALDDQKEFIFVVMMMPDKFAFDFHGFDLAIVELAKDARIPVILELGEFFGKVHGGHTHPPIAPG